MDNFLCYAPEKSIFCAGEDTDPKIGDEGRIPPGDPHATLVAIFGDSKRARRHYCPGGGRMWMRGGAMEAIWGLLIGGSLAGVRVSFFGGSSEFGFRPDVGSRFLA